MATHYIDSNASGSDNGTSWANAFSGIERAYDSFSLAAGDLVKVEYRHNKQYASDPTPAVLANTLFNPVQFVSCDKDNSDAYRSGAIEDSNTIANHYIFSSGGYAFYGIKFIVYDLNFSDTTFALFDDCQIDYYRTFDAEAPGSFFKLINTDLNPTSTVAIINVGGGAVFEWLGGSILANTNNFIENDYLGGQGFISGVDLSGITGGAASALVLGYGATSDEHGLIVFSGCKMHTTLPMLVRETTVNAMPLTVKMIGCHSGNDPYFREYGSQGEVFHESSIYRAGADPSSNNFSAKIVTNTNTSYDNPLRYKLANIWADANPQIVVEILHDSEGAGTGDVFEKQEFWIEIERPKLNNAAFREWDRTNKETPLVTGNDNGTDAGVAWTETSGGITAMTKPVEQRITEQIAGGHAGVHIIWICLAVPSITVYVCPQIDVTY